jgi:L-ascorbate metabolism protein UlaG (beta-lactamase superfamily)
MDESQTRITYVGHATLLIELDGARIMTDPALGRWLGPLLRLGPVPDHSVRTGLDAVLISHLHIDHMDVPSLRRLNPALPIALPRHGAELLERRGFTNVRGVTVGDTLQVGPVEVLVTPASHPGQRYPRGIDGDAVGYLLKGSHTVYFAGDTALFDGMREIEPRPDVACLPVGGWGTSASEDKHLGPVSAAQALTLLSPSLAIPIHWGTYSPPGLLHVRGKRVTELARSFERHAHDLAPDVDVRVVMPGHAITFDGMR